MKTPIHTAYVALGSNMGDRLEHLRFAVHALGRLPISVVDAVSSVYETAPLGPARHAFLNAAVRLRTPVAPRPMLDVLLQIERSRGRVRREKWGPRTLDLDLIALVDERGDLIELRDPVLTLPHPEATGRDFVLRPLLDVEPGLRLAGARVDEHLARLDADARTIERRLTDTLRD